jgi:Rieske Fe-S protein
MMNRKDFLKTCSFCCLSVIGLSGLVSSCAGTKYVQSNVENKRLRVMKSDFTVENKKGNKMRRYVVVRSSNLSYPIVLYRMSDNEYRAILLQCSHQGTELNVNGDLLTCSAHGSEFSNTGEVIQGPAEQNLKQYETSQDPETIFIHLS